MKGPPGDPGARGHPGKVRTPKSFIFIYDRAYLEILGEMVLMVLMELMAIQ